MQSKHDYPALFEEYDRRRASGASHQEIRASFESRGINWGTFQNRRSQTKKVHQSTPQGRQEAPEVHPSTPYEVEALSGHQGPPEADQSTPDESERLEVHPSTPAHQGTLEEYQEVIEEVHQSVPDAPHISTEESTPEHPSTPIVHPEVGPDDSTLAHSGVPARQEHGIGTPSGTPRHTTKKTYVVNTVYVEMIDQYALEQGVEIKDVVNLAFREFFERRHLSEGISHSTEA
jgi:hypothetical protein